MNVSGRTARVLAVGTALLALLAIVAYASRTGVGHTSPTASPSPAWISWGMSVFLIVFVLAIPVAVWAYMQKMQDRAAARRSYQDRVMRSLAFILLLALGGAIYEYLRHHHANFSFFGHLPHLQHALGSQHGRGHSKHVVQAQPHFEWPVLWVTLALLVAAVVAWRWSLARRPVLDPIGPLDEDALAEDVAFAIGDAIDDLEAEPDARRAVIAAYARMEGVLARHGARRRASETPLEYLRRVLLELTAQSAAVTRLTDLFEEAKFSRHRIDTPMKQDAIAALRTIRDDLVRVAA